LGRLHLTTDEELRECARQWPGFLEICARDAKGGTVWEGDGVGAAWANTPFPICNGTFLTRPVKDAADLERRMNAAVEFAAGADLPWVFFVCQGWIPEDLRPGLEAAFSQAGLAMITQMMGMVATGILPPRRPPAELQMRRIVTQEQRREATDLQAFAYQFPVELCRAPLEAGALWGETRQFGYLGYSGGTAVTTATTLDIDGRLYVALVATHPSHQRKGYAESVMRHSLEEAARATGLTRSVLHASPAGYPVYEAMGYRPTAQFIGFGPPH